MIYKIGQRFKWTFPAREVIVEISNIKLEDYSDKYTVICIQKIGVDSGWFVGEIITCYANHLSTYEYLQGQDRADT